MMNLILPLLASVAGGIAGGIGNQQEREAEDARKNREALAKQRQEQGKALASILENPQSPEDAEVLGRNLTGTGYFPEDVTNSLVHSSVEKHKRKQAMDALLGPLMQSMGIAAPGAPAEPAADPNAVQYPTERSAALAKDLWGTGQPGSPAASPAAAPMATPTAQPTGPSGAPMAPTPRMNGVKPTIHITKDGDITASVEPRFASVESENAARYLQAAKQNGTSAMSGLAAARRDGVPVNDQDFYKAADAEFGQAISAKLEQRVGGPGSVTVEDQRKLILETAKQTGYLPDRYLDYVMQKPDEVKGQKLGMVTQGLHNAFEDSLKGQGGLQGLGGGYFAKKLDELDHFWLPNVPMKPQEREAALQEIGQGIFSSLQAELVQSGKYDLQTANMIALEGASHLTGGVLPPQLAQLRNKELPYSDPVKKMANEQGVDLATADKATVSQLQTQANTRSFMESMAGKLDPTVGARMLQEGNAPGQATPAMTAGSIIENEQKRAAELQQRELQQQRKSELQKREVGKIAPPKDFTDMENFVNAFGDVVSWVNEIEYQGKELPTGYISSIWQAVKEKAPLPGMFKSDPAAVKLYASLQVMRDIRARQMAGLSQTNVEVENLEKELATGALQPDALAARLETIRHSALREANKMIANADEVEKDNPAVPQTLRKRLADNDFTMIHELKKNRKKKK